MRTRTRGSPSWPERMLRGRIHYCRLIETNSQKSTCRSGAGHTFGTHRRRKSHSPGGRPRIAQEVRDLIRRMSLENPLWSATKIHGELLKLGIAVAQSIVSIYKVPQSDRPLQTWKTFLSNHMEGIASIDLFVVPTIAFQRLFAFLVLGHERRRLLWFAVTRNPTADWLARQITEAFPWDGAPKYLIRDNDRVFGAVFKARVRAMGIRDRPTSFRSCPYRKPKTADRDCESADTRSR
jgi:hypothetical protein